MEIMENTFITPKQAAKTLSITIDCLRKWEEAGKIAAIKTLGGHRRYNVKDIEQILNSSKNKE
jgi:excisionase family DNA binding protein